MLNAHTLPDWITIAEIKRFNELKNEIFADGEKFVEHDDTDPLMVEYNELVGKILKLRWYSQKLAQAEEDMVSYGGLATTPRKRNRRW